MARTVVAFRSTAQTQSTFTAIAPVADQTVNYDATGKTITVPAQNMIVGCYGMGLHLTQYEISAPSLKTTPVEIDEVDAASTAPSDYPDEFQYLGDAPVAMRSGENFQALTITDGTSGDNNVVVWLDDGLDTVVAPMAGTRLLHGVRATSATTLTAAGWTACPITLDNQLDVGTYAIVGMAAQSATGIAARVIIGNARMGCPMNVDTLLNQRSNVFRDGRFGRRGVYNYFESWGQFVSTALPQVEVFAVSADTAETFYLDLLRVA